MRSNLSKLGAVVRRNDFTWRDTADFVEKRLFFGKLRATKFAGGDIGYGQAEVPIILAHGNQEVVTARIERFRRGDGARA